MDVARRPIDLPIVTRINHRLLTTKPKTVAISGFVMNCNVIKTCYVQHNGDQFWIRRHPEIFKYWLTQVNPLGIRSNPRLKEPIGSICYRLTYGSTRTPGCNGAIGGQLHDIR
jgi:hypothetical protein